MKRFFTCLFKRVVAFVVNALAYIKFGSRGNIIDSPAPGSIIYANHSCIWDFALLIRALYPRTDLRFVATGVQFDKSRFLAWGLKTLGVIRKQQGAHDIVCVRNIIKASREGSVVVIYAAGMTSHEGRPAWDIMPGTGSLAKMLKCDVYTALTEGGFISHPRYAHRSFKGRVDVTVKRLFTASEVAQMTSDEAQTRINEALCFNDWDWQTRERVTFKGMRDTVGLSQTLYMCPACKKEGVMREQKGHLVCAECGFSAERDAYGFFSSSNPACPKRMDAWTDMELNALRDEIGQEDFRLSAKVQMQENKASEGYKPIDTGELVLTKDRIYFSGDTKSESFGFDEFQFLIMSDYDDIKLNTSDRKLRFVFEDKRLITKWFFAHRIMVNGNDR